MLPRAAPEMDGTARTDEMERRAAGCLGMICIKLCLCFAAQWRGSDSVRHRISSLSGKVRQHAARRSVWDSNTRTHEDRRAGAEHHLLRYGTVPLTIC